MSNLKKLLKILSDGKIHSGAELGKKLGITRAAIWKLMERLREFEISIEAKPNQGYCIPGGMELLDAKKIHAQLNNTDLVLKIFDELPSTNGFLLDRARAGQTDIQICLAEYQEQGRGRFGRHWNSPFGKNIALSLLWKFHCDLNQLAGLSLAMGVSVVRVLKQMSVKEGLGLKWPNDVLWEGRKLAGVLIELHAEAHHFCEVVIGLGMNVDFPEAVIKQADKPLIDLKSIATQPFSRNILIANLINAMIDALATFQQKGFSAFLKDWQSFDVAMHQPVQLLLENKKIAGTYRGIDSARGDLLLEDAKGVIHKYSSGEVSLRLGK